MNNLKELIEKNPKLQPVISQTLNSAFGKKYIKDFDQRVSKIGIFEVKNERSIFKLSASGYKHVEGDKYEINILVGSHTEEDNKNIFTNDIPFTSWKIVNFTTREDLSAFVHKQILPIGVDFTRDIVSHVWDIKGMAAHFVELATKLKRAEESIKKDALVKAYEPKTDFHKNKASYGTLDHYDIQNELLSNKSFLLVDEDTNFAGNYDINGESCCSCCVIHCKDIEIDLKKELLIVATKIKSSVITDNNTLEVLIETEIKDLLSDSRKQRPWSVDLQGNDDLCITKTFWYSDDVEKELAWLEVNQPLNINDLYERGYYND